MLSIREGSFEISFLPKGKDYKMTSNGNWATDNRQTGKPTRILRKLLLSKEFSELDFELFNNQLRAIVETGVEFSIVKGSDITYWYHQDRYENLDGTLGNSCMRYPDAQNYFKIYEDFASMLILTKRGKLCGRAIVWEIDGKQYMDRVYVNKDHLVDSFIDYAREHKMYYRKHQGLLSTGDQQAWLSPDSDFACVEYLDLRININKKYEYWPYLDTFRYLHIDSNEECVYISTTPSDGTHTADDPDGWYCAQEEYPYECYHCGHVSYSYDSDECPDDMHWSEYHNDYLCDNCAVYSDTLSDYVVQRYCSRVYSSETNYDYIPTDVLEEETENYIKIEGTWYFTDCTLQTVIDHLNKLDEDKD